MNSTENNELGALRQQVGEIIGTLREVTHSVKETSQKVSGLADIVTRQNECLRRTVLLEEGHAHQSMRLDSLEKVGHRRDGVLGVAGWIARYWPFTAMIGALLAFVAWANGKVG